MKTFKTWAGRSTFSYTGSVKRETRIIYGKGFCSNISGSQYTELLNHFRGRRVDIGTSL